MTWCAKLRREWMPMQASGCGGGGACVGGRERVSVSVSVDLTCCTTRGQGTERQWCLSGRVGLAVGGWWDRYCVVSRTELKRKVNERTRMKYLCKECVDGMDIAAPPPAVDRMASSWRWKGFGDVGVGERERSMVVDVQVWKRRSPRGSWSPRLDWTGLVGRASQPGKVSVSSQSTAS